MGTDLVFTADTANSYIVDHRLGFNLTKTSCCFLSQYSLNGELIEKYSKLPMILTILGALLEIGVTPSIVKHIWNAGTNALQCVGLRDNGVDVHTSVKV